MNRALAITLSFLLTGIAHAQQTPVQTPAPTPQQAPTATVQQPVTTPGKLKVLILEGQNAVNNVLAPTTTTPVVEVRDENDRPVEGAKVEFQLPLTGPSGSFEGGARNMQAVTNVQGQASAPYVPNMEMGRFTIQVKATLGSQTGTASIVQRNSNQSEPIEQRSVFVRHKKLFIIGGVVLVGGIVGAILATRGSGHASSGTTLTITPGVPTVSGPR